jgi:isopenicillin N synthase-like dioxygenase
MKIDKIDLRPRGAQLVDAFKNTGFAILTNHNISPKLLESAYIIWNQFFKLKTEEEKKKFLFDPKTHGGYFPFKSENAKGYDTKDLKEFFHVYENTELPLGPRGRELTMMLRNGLNELGLELLAELQEYLPKEAKKNLGNHALHNMAYESEKTLFRILHYPPIDPFAAQADGAIRAEAHEDINLITLLPAATYPGLQVKGADGEWVMADTDPNSIIVNVGDMLQELTGGYFKSTTHRVVNPTGLGATISRLSMPLFIHPHPETRLSERYTAKSYLEERLRELGLK